MRKRYEVAQIGHKDDIARGNWCWGIKDGSKVVLSVNELNPFRGNREAHEVATICAKALNGQTARDKLIDIAIEFQNDYLSYEKYADHNGLFDDDAKALLELALKISKRPNCHE